MCRCIDHQAFACLCMRGRDENSWQSRPRHTRARNKVLLSAALVVRLQRRRRSRPSQSGLPRVFVRALAYKRLVNTFFAGPHVPGQGADDYRRYRVASAAAFLRTRITSLRSFGCRSPKVQRCPRLRRARSLKAIVPEASAHVSVFLCGSCGGGGGAVEAMGVYSLDADAGDGGAPGCGLFGARPHSRHIPWRAARGAAAAHVSCSPSRGAGLAGRRIAWRQGVPCVFRGSACLETHKTAMVRKVLTPHSTCPHMSSTLLLPPREQLCNRSCSNKHTLPGKTGAPCVKVPGSSRVPSA